MYLVLFLKQKTAYEWRISDWSSAVCSSDLSRAYHFRDLSDGRPVHDAALFRLSPAGARRVRRGQEMDRARGPAAADHLESVADHRLGIRADARLQRRLLARGLVHRQIAARGRAVGLSRLDDRLFQEAEAGRESAQRKEIGRASCRDRVCQYV